MSNHLPSYAPAAGHYTGRPYAQDLYQQHKLTRRNRQNYHLTYSSSPPGSSSPPTTPHSTRRDSAYAYIRLGPEISSDIGLRGESEVLEDPASPWGHRYTAYSSVRYSTHFSTAPPKSARSTANEFPPSSDFDPSEYSEDIDHDVLDLDSEHTSDSAPGHSSTSFSESEEEDSPDQEDKAFDFGQDGYRTTFFRTSAERGQWKNDPIPFRPASLLQARKSVPSLSRIPTPMPITSRTLSEPAPAALENTNFALSEKLNPCSLAIPPPNVSAEPSNEQGVQSPCTVPSLTSDRESSPDMDEHDAPSSPLPPSSPPLSPKSVSISFISRSASPLSVAPSSPLLRSSSSLSEFYTQAQEEGWGKSVEEAPWTDGGEHVNICSPVTFSHALMDLPDELATVSVPEIPRDSPLGPSSNLPLEEPSISVHDLFSDSVVVEEYGSAGANILDGSSLTLPEGASSRSNAPSRTDSSNEASGMDSGPGKTLIPVRSSLLMEITAPSAEDVMEVDGKPSKATDHKDEKNKKTKSARLKGKDGVERPMAKKAVRRRASSPDLGQTFATSSSTSKTKRKSQNSVEDVPVKKKRRTSPGASSSTKDTTAKVTAGTSKKSRSKSNGKGHIDADDLESETSESLPAPKAKRKERNEGERSNTTSSKGKAKGSPRRHSFKIIPESDNESQEPALDPETAALHAEICGMLIETMALSRASSLPVSSLYKSVMQTQPSLKAQRSEKEWMGILDEVLHKGEAARGSGVFGKVESSGKDDSDRPLEAQWFYVPELDEDQERAALIKSMMPRPAKRSETKKYKQYYWRPLEKISKWDPEDEL